MATKMLGGAQVQLSKFDKLADFSKLGLQSYKSPLWGSMLRTEDNLETSGESLLVQATLPPLSEGATVKSAAAATAETNQPTVQEQQQEVNIGGGDTGEGGGPGPGPGPGDGPSGGPGDGGGDGGGGGGGGGGDAE